MATKETAPKKAAPKSMPKEGKNPQGWVDIERTRVFAARDGSHLKAGGTGPADTPEKMKRKGSVLVRTLRIHAGR
jgi:hypothetical protein